MQRLRPTGQAVSSATGSGHCWSDECNGSEVSAPARCWGTDVEQGDGVMSCTLLPAAACTVSATGLSVDRFRLGLDVSWDPSIVDAANEL